MEHLSSWIVRLSQFFGSGSRWCKLLKTLRIQNTAWLRHIFQCSGELFRNGEGPLETKTVKDALQSFIDWLSNNFSKFIINFLVRYRVSYRNGYYLHPCLAFQIVFFRWPNLIRYRYLFSYRCLQWYGTHVLAHHCARVRIILSTGKNQDFNFQPRKSFCRRTVAGPTAPACCSGTCRSSRSSMITSSLASATAFRPAGDVCSFWGLKLLFRIQIHGLRIQIHWLRVQASCWI